MQQTRLMSLIEAIANVAVGYGVAVVAQLIVFPWFGLPAHLDDALAIGGIFTAVSIARSFMLRRLFEAIRVRAVNAGRQPGREFSLISGARPLRARQRRRGAAPHESR